MYEVERERERGLSLVLGTDVGISDVSVWVIGKEWEMNCKRQGKIGKGLQVMGRTEGI